MEPHNNTEFESVVYTPAVIEFVTVANEYCKAIEDIGDVDRERFVNYIQRILPLLYLKATLLPSITSEDIDYPEKFVTESDYFYVQDKMKGLLKDLDIYQEVFNKDFEFSDEALDASISEDLSDIYQSLKDFILNYQIGAEESMISSLQDCSNSFKEYWGQNLVNTLRAVHNLVYGDIDLKDSEND